MVRVTVEEARRVADEGVDAILLDSGDQRLAVKLLGGTGRVHDWSVSRRVVEVVRVPVFLAGGLNSENVQTRSGPCGASGWTRAPASAPRVCSNESKLAAFLATVAAADGSSA